MKIPIDAGQAADARKNVIVLGMALAFISYLDRACISQAAPMIARDLHFSSIQMGYIFSAFALTYAAMEVPSGWLIDRYGPRLVLNRVVLCWSAFTAATGVAWNFGSMMTARLLFGAGESGCFPGLAKLYSDWLPREERARAEGWKACSARWGAGAAPLLVTALYASLGWRLTFTLFGAAGLAWAAFFHVAFFGRSEPGKRGARGAAPWRAFLRSRSAWALYAQWFCHFYGFYFYVTWLPTYLWKARGIVLTHNAILSALPMLSAGCGCLFAGYALPLATLRWGVVATRKAFAYLAYGGAALFLLLFPTIHDANYAMVVMSMSSFVVELSAPVTWTTAMDLGGKSVGLLTGIMNTVGHLGGSVAPTVIGYLLAASANNWNLAFYASAALYTVGGLCWIGLDPVTKLDQPARA